MDLKLDTESSLAHIATARKACPKARIIMVTGYASIATTVEAIKQGADDYLPKPVSVDDILRKYVGDETMASPTEEVLSPRRLEWEHIQRVLQDNGGNISKTAEQLSMHRRTLQRKLQKKPQL
jgi:two-component system response regulator RegA